LRNPEPLNNKRGFFIYKIMTLEEKIDKILAILEKRFKEDNYELFLKYYEADKTINKTKLSNILNISRQQIYNYIKKYDSTTKN